MKKIAIIGASYLQDPLIQKAKKRGIETHVFSWGAGEIGEKSADHFYPISIVEKEEILRKCAEIGIDGICSIASDLAVITVNYVAEKMKLTGNSIESTEISTNKHKMRQRFFENHDPSPASIMVKDPQDLNELNLQYPLIVKPLDRSGSRGITKVYNDKDLIPAIANAKKHGFIKAALVEEFLTGEEYSVEFISWKGHHHFLALTKKYTTGSPHFIEKAHLEPATIDPNTLNTIKKVITHALTGLGIQNGASHSEIKITDSGKIGIVEIGGRMGGDFIGSDLVELSTGFDFVNAVIDVALGQEPQVELLKDRAAGVRFVFNEDDLSVIDRLKKEHPEYLIREDIKEIQPSEINDSSERYGYVLISAENADDIEHYLS
ncbi:MAG: ATP-grasp domain-containing protein [Lachnospiraceae bacterium]|nr:ATP-grasp domain-containing protein [Lachnospiraceae bacterium]